MRTAVKHQNKKHRDSSLNLWRLLCWLLVLTGGAFTVTLDAAEPVRFSEHLLVNEHRYTFGIRTVDIDGDGDLDLTYPDVYTGGAQGESNLYWLENNGQGNLQRHVIHKDERGWMERHAHGDINGDGRPDLAMVDNRWGRLFWFENPDRPADSHWKKHMITTKCPHAYDVVLSDLDGDGDLDAASSGFASGQITWYENPGRDGLDGEWTRRVIDEEMPESRTIAVGDFNSDGRIDLLATAIGKMNLAADAQDHGSQVVWYENLGQTASARWKKHSIDNRSRGPCHGHPADLDGDGDLDVVMAHGMRTTIDPKVERHEVVWYENVGPPKGSQPKSGRSWKRHLVGRLPFAFEAIAEDLDSDGDLDVIATAWANTPRLYLIEKPASIERGKRHPLVVYLHGRGQGHKFQWLSKDFTQFRKRAAERGYFVLIPHLGTDNWMNARTRRVLTELLDKTLESYPIDEARVHFMGMSMGGGGSLTYTAYNTSRVRSVCNIFGVTDFTQFFNQRPRYHKSLSEALDGTPDTAADVYRAQSPMAHLDAFAKVPVFVLHGDGDQVVPVVHSRQFVKAMQTREYDVVYKEVPGGRHSMSLLHGFEDKILDFFDETGAARSQKPQVD